MSLFRKPKKTIQRRVFSAVDEDAAENSEVVEKMDVDEPHSNNFSNHSDIKKEKKKDKKSKNDDTKSKKALLSFADDEEEGEVFQVKKSSHSKKMMRMLDRERRKKKSKGSKDEKYDRYEKYSNDDHREDNKEQQQQQQKHQQPPMKTVSCDGKEFKTQQSQSQSSSNNNVNNSDSIQTEIRTDDFVLVVKKSEPENIILNGRAALCAGRDDMSSEDEDSRDSGSQSHRFAKPENFKLVLESGSIPDAAMIHAARKRRQKAREQGDFISIEEHSKESSKKGNRLIREDGEDDASDEEERVDMSAITGAKEREERREKFYAVENEYSGDESDQEMNEWENQQIRKGVTGAQLVTAQQESVLSRFIIKPTNHIIEDETPQSTGTLLEQAYAKSFLEKPRQVILSTQKSENKPSGPRTPQEITDTIKKRLVQLKVLNEKHEEDIDRIEKDLRSIKLEAINCAQKAPTAATKYRFYQELRGYVTDLVECLDEKAPIINDLEKRILNILSKHANFLIERRRQDVRDQAKEMSDASKPGGSKKGPEYEAMKRRTAEREGRRTRRRCDREKTDYLMSHLDGMSSDDEMPDQDIAQYKNNLDQVEVEGDDLFHDTCEDYCKTELILSKFEVWRKTDMDSYKDAFVSLCLPKILGQIIRVEMLIWNPLDEKYQEIEKMNWYSGAMQYAYNEEETEESLAIDPDNQLVPIIIEKIILPKLTELIENCWDPLSTSQTLRLIGLIGRLGREYPSLKETSKPLQTLFNTILDKMKNSLDNDVFIPLFPKQVQEAKSSFFQRQFCSGLKLFRNILSWQGIIADRPLRELAISSLLNRYLLSAMRVCAPVDAISKAYIIVNTLPTVWLQSESECLENLNHFIAFIKYTLDQLDKRNPNHMHYYDKAKQILQRLHY